jgi:hypothetical protein
MTLDQGYNLVTEAVADTESIKMRSLEFFRTLAVDGQVATSITVTGSEDPLYYADEHERRAVLSTLRQTLRSSHSLGSMDVVQFVLMDGLLMMLSFVYELRKVTAVSISMLASHLSNSQNR